MVGSLCRLSRSVSTSQVAGIQGSTHSAVHFRLLTVVTRADIYQLDCIQAQGHTP